MQITGRELKRLQEVERQFNLIQIAAQKWSNEVKNKLKTNPDSKDYYDGIICGINLIFPLDENGKYIPTK